MKKEMKKNIIIITICWILITGFILIFNESILKFGKEIQLKVYPVDPRDFLRGDYVVLDYEISKIPKFNPYYYSKDYRDVYVVLKRKTDEEVYQMKRIETQKPDKNELFIKGELKNGKIYYPSIEKYFVKENEGRKIEQGLIKGGIAKVSINKNGESRIKEIIVKN